MCLKPGTLCPELLWEWHQVVEMPLQVAAHLAVATWLSSSFRRALYSKLHEHRAWGI